MLDTGLWQARCAVLALLANYLHQSPAMQLKSVRDWDMVSALFELLWEEKARRIALRLVGPSMFFLAFANLLRCDAASPTLKLFDAFRLLACLLCLRPQIACGLSLAGLNVAINTVTCLCNLMQQFLKAQA